MPYADTLISFICKGLIFIIVFNLKYQLFFFTIKETAKGSVSTRAYI